MTVQRPLALELERKSNYAADGGRGGWSELPGCSGSTESFIPVASNKRLRRHTTTVIVSNLKSLAYVRLKVTLTNPRRPDASNHAAAGTGTLAVPAIETSKPAKGPLSIEIPG